MIIDVLGSELKITFPFDYRIINVIKSFPGKRYDPKQKAWFIPIATSEKPLSVLGTLGFVTTPEALDAIGQWNKKRIAGAVLQGANDAAFESVLPLFPYQRVGAEFLSTIENGLLADEVGAGKTLQALAVGDKTPGKVLIFVPAALKWQWESEIKKFLPHWKAVVVDGSAQQRVKLWKTEAKAYIANYELLLRDLPHIQAHAWDLIVCDEATRIANTRSKTHKALWKIPGTRKIALTGTPVQNRPDDVYGIFHWLCPGVLGPYMDFIGRYCIRNQWGGTIGYVNLEELAMRIKPFMLRRKKEDIAPEIPEKIEIDVPFKLSEKERLLYSRIRKELLFEIEKGDISKIENPVGIQNTLSKMLRLRQIANGMELVGDSTTSSKIEVLREILHEVVGAGRKVIVFTFFAEMAKILCREFDMYNPLMLIGETKDRKRLTELFNNDPERKMLISTGAGQYGLNFQVASVIIHYDQEWSISKMTQREGRAHRIGQKEAVLVYNILAKGTMDMYIREKLRGKKQVSDLLLDDTHATLQDIKDVLTYEENL